MLKIGLIGCGGMGSKHARCYADTENAILAAIADIRPEIAEKPAKENGGAVIYADAEEMLKNEKLDIVDICLPTYLHTEYAVKAMKAGANVFLEKPVCLTESEAELLLKTEKETGVKVGVGHVIRFWNEYVWLKKAADSGKYGKLISAHFERLSENPSWGWDDWYNDYQKSGGAALDLHIHDADFVRYLMGREPDTISSFATKNTKGEIQEIQSIYTYGDTVLSAVGVWDLPQDFPFQMNFRAKFEKATAVYRDGILTLYKEDGTSEVIGNAAETQADENVKINITTVSAYENEIREFVNYVSGIPGAEIASLSEAIASARLVWKETEIAENK